MQETSSVSSRKHPWRTIVIAVIVAAITIAGFAVFSAKETAPEVTYTTLSGEKVTSQSLRGKVVMVNFWATSCVTCIKEMPDMVRTYNKYKGQGLEFIAVAMNYDPPNYVLNYVHTRSLPFKVALDTQGEIARSFGDVKLTPTTFVIDKSGHIIKRYIGEPEFPALHQLLEKELAA